MLAAFEQMSTSNFPNFLHASPNYHLYHRVLWLAEVIPSFQGANGGTIVVQYWYNNGWGRKGRGTGGVVVLCCRNRLNLA